MMKSLNITLLMDAKKCTDNGRVCEAIAEQQLQC